MGVQEDIKRGEEEEKYKFYFNYLAREYNRIDIEEKDKQISSVLVITFPKEDVNFDLL